MTSLSGHPETEVIVEAKLLSASEATAAMGKHPVFHSANQRSSSDLQCRAHAQDSGLLVIPVELASTDSNGQFKLLGLLPGLWCLAILP